jgi:hypothetical protein
VNGSVVMSIQANEYSFRQQGVPGLLAVDVEVVHRWFRLLRLYKPLEPVSHKAWKPNDCERAR